VESLIGDASKARGSSAGSRRFVFSDLVTEMVREDLREAEREQFSRQHGFVTVPGRE